MLLSQGRNTNHVPFHWLITSAVAVPGSVLHAWSAHPHSECNRSESYIWPEGRSGFRTKSHLSALAALQTFSQRAQLTALGSKESRAGWSGPSRESSPCGHNYCGCFSWAWWDSAAFKLAIRFCFRAAFPSFHELAWSLSWVLLPYRFSCPLPPGCQGLCVRNKPHPNQTKMRWAGEEKHSRKNPLSVNNQK